jgi:hypothetical protein
VFANRFHDTEHDKRCKGENTQKCVVAIFFGEAPSQRHFRRCSLRKDMLFGAGLTGQIDWNLHAI